MQATAIITANEGKLSKFLPEINNNQTFYNLYSFHIRGHSQITLTKICPLLTISQFK